MSIAKILKQMKHPFKVFSEKEVKANVKALAPHFQALKDDLYLQKSLNLPAEFIMRQRRMMGYNVEFDNEGKITLHDNYQLENYQADQKLKTNARLYEQFTDELKNDPNFKSFLLNTLQICGEVKSIKRATITCHAVRTISYENQPAQPTPEGAHQDGVDLEVLAVVNKQNCVGAESQIFTPNKESLLFEMTLDPGEGYFIDGLNLWHYATDHLPVDPTKIGVRDLIGYMLKVEETY